MYITWNNINSSLVFNYKSRFLSCIWLFLDEHIYNLCITESHEYKVNVNHRCAKTKVIQTVFRYNPTLSPQVQFMHTINGDR